MIVVYVFLSQQALLSGCNLSSKDCAVVPNLSVLEVYQTENVLNFKVVQVRLLKPSESADAMLIR